jgi:hypothetical protein
MTARTRLYPGQRIDPSKASSQSIGGPPSPSTVWDQGPIDASPEVLLRSRASQGSEDRAIGQTGRH